MVYTPASVIADAGIIDVANTTAAVITDVVWSLMYDAVIADAVIADAAIADTQSSLTRSALK